MAVSTIAGTNCWTSSEDLMVTVLVACSSLLSFLSVTDAAAARAGNLFIDSIAGDPRVGYGETLESFTADEWKSLFPHVIVGTPGGESELFALTTESSGPTFAATGVIEIQFAVLADVNSFEYDQERAFKNSVGDILEELAEQAMDMRQIIVVQYGRNPESDHEQQGVIQQAVVQVAWGHVTESAN